MAWWLAHRGGGNPEEALCALLFNAQGYLHEMLRARKILRARRSRGKPNANPTPLPDGLEMAPLDLLRMEMSALRKR